MDKQICSLSLEELKKIKAKDRTEIQKKRYKIQIQKLSRATQTETEKKKLMEKNRIAKKQVWDKRSKEDIESIKKQKKKSPETI